MLLNGKLQYGKSYYSSRIEFLSKTLPEIYNLPYVREIIAMRKLLHCYKELCTVSLCFN